MSSKIQRKAPFFPRPQPTLAWGRQGTKKLGGAKFSNVCIQVTSQEEAARAAEGWAPLHR